MRERAPALEAAAARRPRRRREGGPVPVPARERARAHAITGRAPGLRHIALTAPTTTENFDALPRQRRARGSPPRARLPSRDRARGAGRRGPRSVTVTRTDAPVRGLVTRICVPSGRVRWAAVRPRGRTAEPLAVRRPLNSAPYHGRHHGPAWHAADEIRIAPPARRAHRERRRRASKQRAGDRSPAPD